MRATWNYMDKDGDETTRALYRFNQAENIWL